MEWWKNISNEKGQEKNSDHEATDSFRNIVLTPRDIILWFQAYFSNVS